MPPRPIPGQSVVQLSYVDHPDVAETFADAIEKVWVDGSTIRIEFVVNRMDPVTPQTQPTGKKHTVCRLVLPLTALPGVAGQLSNIVQNLVQKRVIHPASPPQSGRPN